MSESDFEIRLRRTGTVIASLVTTQVKIKVKLIKSSSKQPLHRTNCNAIVIRIVGTEAVTFT